ncbi:hypothetical protein ACFE04_017666 [Oxalis oulophora]
MASNKLDHIFDSSKPDISYRDLICDDHANEISKLGYCVSHRKLAESEDMCEDCLSKTSTKFAFFPWMNQIGMIQGSKNENSDLNLNCSCCGVHLESSKLCCNDSCFLVKPSWEVLDCAEKVNLIIANDDGEEDIDDRDESVLDVHENEQKIEELESEFEPIKVDDDLNVSILDKSIEVQDQEDSHLKPIEDTAAKELDDGTINDKEIEGNFVDRDFVMDSDKLDRNEDEQIVESHVLATIHEGAEEDSKSAELQSIMEEDSNKSSNFINEVAVGESSFDAHEDTEEEVIDMRNDEIKAEVSIGSEIPHHESIDVEEDCSAKVFQMQSDEVEVEVSIRLETNDHEPVDVEEAHSAEVFEMQSDEVESEVSIGQEILDHQHIDVKEDYSAIDFEMQSDEVEAEVSICMETNDHEPIDVEEAHSVKVFEMQSDEVESEVSIGQEILDHEPIDVKEDYSAKDFEMQSDEFKIEMSIGVETNDNEPIDVEEVHSVEVFEMQSDEVKAEVSIGQEILDHEPIDVKEDYSVKDFKMQSDEVQAEVSITSEIHEPVNVEEDYSAEVFKIQSDEIEAEESIGAEIPNHEHIVVEEDYSAKDFEMQSDEVKSEVSIGPEIPDHDPIDVEEDYPAKCANLHIQDDDGAYQSENEFVEFKTLSVDTNELVMNTHLMFCSEIGEDKFPETPTSIDSPEYFFKKSFRLQRKESGTEDSFDGSVMSETDGVMTMEKLKTTLRAERKALSEVFVELEEERSASAIAANQTMAMINRLQEEKAAMQMEALQYQRMMEEQLEYDQEALQLLNELILKGEREKAELEKELEMYRSRTSSACCSITADDNDELSTNLKQDVKEEDFSNGQNTSVDEVLCLANWENGDDKNERFDYSSEEYGFTVYGGKSRHERLSLSGKTLLPLFDATTDAKTVNGDIPNENGQVYDASS